MDVYSSMHYGFAVAGRKVHITFNLLVFQGNPADSYRPGRNKFSESILGGAAEAGQTCHVRTWSDESNDVLYRSSDFCIGDHGLQLHDNYGRIWHIAVAPLALACGAAGPLRSTFVSYLKSFVGVCLQGVVIVIVCMVFSAFANNFDFNTVQTSDQQIVELKEDMTEEEFQAWWEQWGMDNKELEAKKAEVLWTYLSQMLFLYLIMAGMIKGADNFIHQKLNL